MLRKMAFNSVPCFGEDVRHCSLTSRDDCEPTFAYRGRPINGSIDSPLETQLGTELASRHLIKSAYRDTVESDMHRNHTNNQKQEPNEKNKSLRQ